LIGFGFVGSGATDVQPANIGYVETSNSGGTNGAIVFLTRSVTTSTATPSERMRIDSSGNVGIGLTNATHLLQVSTDDAAKPGVGGLWTVISDERVKTNIQDLDDGLGILNNLRVREFEYNKEACAYYKFPVGQKQYGFIAQEYEKVFPNDVKVTSGDTKIGKLCVKNLKQINTGQTSALVIRAIQQLDERLTALEKRLE
jgi:hypothetical protein